MIVKLIRNIAVIIVNNNDGLIDIDKISNCVALNTSYKIHVLVEDTNKDFLDGWSKLKAILNFIDMTNDNKRPIYVHYKNIYNMDLTFLRQLSNHGFNFDMFETLQISKYKFKKNRKRYYVESIIVPHFSL